MNKEQILTALDLGGLSNQTSEYIQISANGFYVPNGGVLQLSMFKFCYEIVQQKHLDFPRIIENLTNRFKSRIHSFSSFPTRVGGKRMLTSSYTNATEEEIQSVLGNLTFMGESLFFKKPNETMTIKVMTDKTLYFPGE